MPVIDMEEADKELEAQLKAVVPFPPPGQDDELELRGALPLKFPLLQKDARAGEDSAGAYVSREFVLEDSAVAEVRRKGLPKGDQEVAVEELIRIIQDDGIDLSELEVQDEPEPEEPFIDLKGLSCMVVSPEEAATSHKRKKEQEELERTRRHMPKPVNPDDHARNVLSAAARVLERGPPRAFTIWAAENIHSLPSGKKPTLRKILAKEGLQDVKMSRLGLRPEDAVLVGQYTSLNKRLWELDMSFNNIGDEGAAIIAASVRSHSSLRVLKLRANGIAFHGAQELATMIQINQALKELDLSANHFGARESSAIAAALTANRFLTSLQFASQYRPKSGKSIGEAGAAAFAASIATGKDMKLQTLDLSHNQLGPLGAKALEKALMKPLSPLSTLIISHNSFGKSGAFSLARALEKNESITALDISYNNLGERKGRDTHSKGLDSLCRGIGRNKKLRTLDLSGNGLTNHGATTLSFALRDHPTIATLKLHRSEIETLGAQQLSQLALGHHSLGNVELFGNILRPPIDSMRAKRSDIFLSRQEASPEERGTRWTHYDLNTTKIGLIRKIRSSVEIPTNVLVNRGAIRVPVVNLPQIKSFAASRPRVFV